MGAQLSWSFAAAEPCPGRGTALVAVSSALRAGNRSGPIRDNLERPSIAVAVRPRNDFCDRAVRTLAVPRGTASRFARQVPGSSHRADLNVLRPTASAACWSQLESLLLAETL